MVTINYLEICDFHLFITDTALRKLVGSNTCKIQDCQSIAAGFIIEKLSKRYKAGEELGKSGNERNQGMVRWMAVLSIYYLYQSVPDADIPERVRVNYEDVVEEIRRVSAGKDGTTLEERADPDGQPVTGGMFRFTSNPRRSHDPY